MNKQKILVIGISLLALTTCVIFATVKSTSKIFATQPTPAPAQIMVQIKSKNWELLSLEEDSWLESSWRVYYNGQVEYSDKYRFSGEKTKTWSLSNDQLNTAYTFFLDNKRTNPTNALDGTGYEIVMYNQNGSIEYDFNGYIYGTPFEKITEYIGPWDN